jgi:hypothetical protein
MGLARKLIDTASRQSTYNLREKYALNLTVYLVENLKLSMFRSEDR